jgi:hypothetical protein
MEGQAVRSESWIKEIPDVARVDNHVDVVWPTF